MRIGQGVDVHAFEEGDHVVLAGVHIPHTQGLKAHSDGDVALHALCDALLGAAGLGDIGRHFPDTDPGFKNIDSRELLRMTYQKVQKHSYRLINADMTLVAQTPRLSEYIEQMCAVVAKDLNVSTNQINVKATTTEHLGFTGRKEGIAAFAIVLLESQ
ncbi:MAG: 2-C-methyl-D-erythritol 2,4-cyclodiphosphate synthase [Gammaproteobacteria bacterium]